MSHAATNWAIKQRGLKPATKIVLWHLSDCHNGHTGQCNPKQSTLADLCEMSRSTLNLHLDKLEEAGLIRRIVTVEDTTKRQQPTHYVLAMDDEKPVSEKKTRTQYVDQPSLDIAEPCPKTGHGAVSEKQPEPCPDFGKSRVRISDTYKRNPGKEPGRGTGNIPKADAFGRDASNDVDSAYVSKQAFDEAITYLGQTGTAEKQARAIVGRWRRDHPDQAIREAMQASARAGVLDPVPWITARLGAIRSAPEAIPLERLRLNALAQLHAEDERKAASR